MEVADRHSSEPSDKSKRKDPRGFVVAIVLALFAVTAIAVVTMQLATEFNWQL